MTNDKETISPELRDLLGDVSGQRESVLLSLEQGDVVQLAGRPAAAPIRSSYRSMSAAEREILDTRRVELATLLHHLAQKQIERGVEGFETIRVEPSHRLVGVATPIVGERARDLATTVLASAEVEGSAVVDAGDDAAGVLRLFTAASRLVPSAASRIGVAYALRATGARPMAARLAASVAASASTPAERSYASEALAVLAGDAQRPRDHQRHYADAAQWGTERLVVVAQWAYASILVADREQVELARQALDGFETTAHSEVVEWMALRREAMMKGLVDVPAAATTLARALLERGDILMREVARALV